MDKLNVLKEQVTRECGMSSDGYAAEVTVREEVTTIDPVTG